MPFAAAGRQSPSCEAALTNSCLLPESAAHERRGTEHAPALAAQLDIIRSVILKRSPAAALQYSLNEIHSLHLFCLVCYVLLCSALSLSGSLSVGSVSLSVWEFSILYDIHCPLI